MMDINNSGYRNIDVAEVKAALDAGVALILVDVRTPQEYSKGKIGGSINIPLGEIDDTTISELKANNKAVYVYCLSGSRSEIAAAELSSKGLNNVFNMNNGLLAWRAKGFQVEN